MGDRIIIKKYSNRRLYDTRQSKYINLEDIPVLLKEGFDVAVLDAGNGDDITAAVLLQLIVEREKRKVEGLPVELLKEFLVLQDTPFRKFFDMAIQQGLAMLREMKRVGFAIPQARQANLLDPNYWMERFFPGAFTTGNTTPPPPPEPTPEPPPEEEAVETPVRGNTDAIYEQLAQLQARLERIERESKDK